MQTRTIFLTISFVVVFVVALTWLTARPIPASTMLPEYSTSETLAVPQAASQESPLQDGASLIESHCAGCHAAHFLEQTRKTRSEWENTLAKMQRMGVPLSNAEKTILLDYLTVADEP